VVDCLGGTDGGDCVRGSELPAEGLQVSEVEELEEIALGAQVHE
jgi:hypothetical protein